MDMDAEKTINYFTPCTPPTRLTITESDSTEVVVVVVEIREIEYLRLREKVLCPSYPSS